MFPACENGDFRRSFTVENLSPTRVRSWFVNVLRGIGMDLRNNKGLAITSGPGFAVPRHGRRKLATDFAG